VDKQTLKTLFSAQTVWQWFVDQVRVFMSTHM